MRRISLLCLLLLFILSTFLPAEQQIALVIGNASYLTSPLRNPANDARDVSTSLSNLGFQVTTLIDANQQKMEEAIFKFGTTLAEGGVGLFYYAGHSAQFNGENHLIPVNATIRSAPELRYKAVPAGVVLEYMKAAENSLNMVILDACRDNPFAGSRSANRGLAVVGNLPKGSIIVYATAPGSVAEDGAGRNSPFTQAFLKHVETSDLDVKDLFDNIGNEVSSITKNRQRPWIATDFYGKFYFSKQSESIATKAEESKPAFSVEKSKGSLIIQVKTAGTFYLDGAKQGRIPSGGTARLSNLETGNHTLEMRYVDGKRETREISVEKDQTMQVAFSYVELPKVSDDFVLVEAGSFYMGSSDGLKVENAEKPMHSVTIGKSFYMSEYEVTQGQWHEVMGTNPSHFKGDNLPVERVSWYDAAEYCNRLSKKEGLVPAYRISGEDVTWDLSANGYRLPSEAEWEYAALNGNKSSGFTYSGSNSVSDVGWHKDNSGSRTHKVGLKRPNELGLYDMSGNVWEWCWDWYDKNYYGSSPSSSPHGPSGGSARVFRGGSWLSFARSLRVAGRNHHPPLSEKYFLGFRPVRTAE